MGLGTLAVSFSSTTLCTRELAHMSDARKPLPKFKVAAAVANRLIDLQLCTQNTPVGARSLVSLACATIHCERTVLPDSPG
eukprot:1464447-Amphidinium_carterae.2